MPDRIGRLTPLEESTMNVLWTVGTPLTVAEVHAKLDYPTAVMLVTVNRTLRRLHDAGYAQRTTLGTAPDRDPRSARRRVRLPGRPVGRPPEITRLTVQHGAPAPGASPGPPPLLFHCPLASPLRCAQGW